MRHKIAAGKGARDIPTDAELIDSLPPLEINYEN